MSDRTDRRPVDAVPDLDRDRRLGFPEVIYAEGKTPDQVVAISRQILEASGKLLVTRTDAAHRDALAVLGGCRTHEPSTAVTFGHEGVARAGRVVVAAAGTTDLSVAEEAAVTAEMLGCEVERLYDVGVAGLHRLLERLDRFEDASAVIVVAGFEGALPSVVGGLVPAPLIAVPTSVGYGASFDGLAALLAMLNACAPGVLVVNIDNGFGAGYAAGRINAIVTRRDGKHP